MLNKETEVKRVMWWGCDGRSAIKLTPLYEQQDKTDTRCVLVMTLEEGSQHEATLEAVVHAQLGEDPVVAMTTPHVPQLVQVEIPARHEKDTSH